MGDDKRILVVDDNQDDSSLIALVLAKDLPEARVVCAGDRDRFEELLERTSFDAAITESRVSWASGFELFRAVRRVAPGCPVLMFTGRGDEETASEALKQGFADYLPKSARGYLQLCRRLRQSLERRVEAVSCTALVARYQLLFEIVEQPAFFATAGGTVIEANPAFARLLRDFCLSSTVVLKGRSLTELLPSSQLSHFLETLVPGRPRSLVLEIDHRPSPSRVRLDACLLDPGLRLPAVVVGTLEPQEALRPGQLSASAAGNERAHPAQQPELGHVVAHDLQAPVREVSRYVRLLADRLGAVDAETRHCLDHVTSGANRMRMMLDRYTECLKAGAGGKRFEKVALQEALARVQASLRDSIEEAKATIVYSNLPTVWGNFDDIVRLFQNLVENGLKFRQPGPPVLEIKAIRGSADWFISVKDNGIGIDERDFPRIFRMFQRLHTAEERPGLGMGLPICKGIVEAHGGKIWVESCPGFGSTFHFTLPVVSESHETEQKDERNDKATAAPGS